jgi:hypothetical protein
MTALRPMSVVLSLGLTSRKLPVSQAGGDVNGVENGMAAIGVDTANDPEVRTTQQSERANRVAGRISVAEDSFSYFGDQSRRGS